MISALIQQECFLLVVASDHHLIVATFTPGAYVLILCLTVRNFQRLNLDKLAPGLPVMTFGMMFCQDLLTFPIEWSVLI